jgi:Ca-activated chloride channel family protein
MGNLKSALTAFENALQQKPDYEDAIYNRQIVLKMIAAIKDKYQMPTDDESNYSQENQELSDLEGEEETKKGEEESDEKKQTGSTSQKPDQMMNPQDLQNAQDNEETRELVLRRLSDDPATFLKAKFAIQYRLTKQRIKKPDNTW